MRGLAEKLVALRREKLPGVSCRAASELAGLGSGTLRRYESGDRVPRLRELEALAELYGVDVEDILKK